MCIYIYIYRYIYIGAMGVPEEDISSLGMMGYGAGAVCGGGRLRREVEERGG